LTQLPSAGGFDSFAVNGDLDTLSAMFLRLSSPPAGKISLHFLDPQTVVFADPEPMKKFLEEKRRPTQMTQPPPPTPQPPPAPPGGPGGAPAAPAPPPAAGTPLPGKAGPAGRGSIPNANDETSFPRVSHFQAPGTNEGVVTPPPPRPGQPGGIGNVAGKNG